MGAEAILAGMQVLVTGAASGMGKEICLRFIEEGARVTATDINLASLEESFGHLPEIDTVEMDVGDMGSVRSTFSSLTQLDGLVCAAGIVGSRFGDGPVGECEEEGWDHVMNVNLKGVWRCCKFAIPLMQGQSGGGIVNLSSTTALRPPQDFFKSHAYITSKGGVVTLTRAIASYYGREKIRANVIAPGMIDSPMSKRMQGLEDVMSYLEQQQPLGALGTCGDIAEAALFLTSDASKFISGTVMPVDGGWNNHG